MLTVDCISIHAPLERVFDVAQDVEGWPEILPHYRWVRFLERDATEGGGGGGGGGGGVGGLGGGGRCGRGGFPRGGVCRFTGSGPAGARRCRLLRGATRA